MKKIFLLTAFLFTINLCHSQVLITLLLGDKLNTGKIEFGLDGGFNWSGMDGLESKTALRTFNLGFYFDFLIKENWYFNTGVLVKSSVGAYDISENDLLLLDPTFVFVDSGSYYQQINYFHIPLAIKYRFQNHFYFRLGPQLALRTKAKVIFDGRINGKSVVIENDNSDLFTRLEASVLAGVGYKLKQGKGMNIGIKYFYGLTDVYKGDQLDIKNNSLYAYVNIPIGRGKALKEEKSGD